MILPSFSVRLDYFKAFDCCCGFQFVWTQKHFWFPVDGAFVSANTQITHTSQSWSVLLLLLEIISWLFIVPYLAFLLNKFIWCSPNLIFCQIGLLHPSLKILLLPSLLCFRLHFVFSWFFSCFQRIFNLRLIKMLFLFILAMLISLRPGWIIISMLIPGCDNGFFQIMLGSLIFQNVKPARS
jgi:hypothetical protein